MTKAPRTSSKLLVADNAPQIRTRPRKPRDSSQPQFSFDPMPDRIEPCLALLKQKVPIGPEWIYEIKWDGYRLHVHLEQDRVRILTRGGHDWTRRFPKIEVAARKLPVSTAILDGEAVALDENGLPSFGLLQQSLGGRGGKAISQKAEFFVFDLLYFDGHDLTELELSSRRHLLEGLLNGGRGAIKLSEEFDSDGNELLAGACRYGLEGIIAKNRSKPYRSGRLGDWIKVKCVQSDSFVIVGYERSAVASRGIRSLLLAGRKGDDLVYVGDVGTGFKERDLNYMRKTLDAIKTNKPAVPIKGKDVVFVEPTLIAEIEYRSWTHDGHLRHPSYKGLREKQDNASIYELT